MLCLLGQFQRVQVLLHEIVCSQLTIDIATLVPQLASFGRLMAPLSKHTKKPTKHKESFRSLIIA